MVTDSISERTRMGFDMVSWQEYPCQSRCGVSTSVRTSNTISRREYSSLSISTRTSTEKSTAKNSIDDLFAAIALAGVRSAQRLVDVGSHTCVNEVL